MGNIASNNGPLVKYEIAGPHGICYLQVEKDLCRTALKDNRLEIDFEFPDTYICLGTSSTMDALACADIKKATWVPSKTHN
ncbi:hypothetical protein SDRG_12062 [Saprolegnia diclina VS20]|uniref:Uncharacterized protein n=1 Tax=Saprolegnia diclina (strain VS20) TaxID=1156394 RepID=T0Q6H6_SAPDV|nr:hypothetical protein SDRG_12062 [Saprolegnia diclina VS20]EQC30211.1 hypothetical protein SDRG_12062 [Saprolegnia diclina VS20]|eukprot:XP_008616343.1 hypothetical protein SDRG_12062 [Saprolegnia diclina VS20]